MKKAPEVTFFEEVKRTTPIFYLTGIEFTLGEYDCVITDVTFDPNIELGTILIQPMPGSNYFESVKLEVKLK